MEIDDFASVCLIYTLRSMLINLNSQNEWMKSVLVYYIKFDFSELPDFIIMNQLKMLDNFLTAR